MDRSGSLGGPMTSHEGSFPGRAVEEALARLFLCKTSLTRSAPSSLPDLTEAWGGLQVLSSPPSQGRAQLSTAESETVILWC